MFSLTCSSIKHTSAHLPLSDGDKRGDDEDDDDGGGGGGGSSDLKAQRSFWRRGGISHRPKKRRRQTDGCEEEPARAIETAPTRQA